MHKQLSVAAASLALMLAGCQPARAQAVKPQTPAPTSVADEQQQAETQAALIRLLRITPVLTSVVERDPSLLTNVEYVSKSNPELEQFLVTHPEVTRNPDFYLFSGLHSKSGQRREALDRKIWPEYSYDPDRNGSTELIREIGPFVIFAAVLGALLWLIQVFIRNRRWQRTFKAQMDAREKLIDRFSNNDQLVQYMETAGRSLLEMPIMAPPDEGMPNVVARVFTSLQIGMVLTLLGIGFLMVEHVMRSQWHVFLVAAVIFLMPGIGFVLSAAISWQLSARLGLLPATKTSTTEQPL